MKAFSPEMFTEQAQASLRQEAYNILEQKPMAIRSVLEAEDDSIMMEMQARREMYISLLESQQQGLGIIDEAGLGGKMIAAIIAGIIAIIGAVIAMITGKGSGGGSTPSPSTGSGSQGYSKAVSDLQKEIKKSNQDLQAQARDIVDNANKRLENLKSGKSTVSPGFDRAMQDKNAVLTFDKNHNGEFLKKNDVGVNADEVQRGKISISSQTKVFNPLWHSSPNIDLMNYRFDKQQYLRICRAHPTVEVHNYVFPDIDLCSGNITVVKTLCEATEKIKSLIHDMVERNIRTGDEADTDKYQSSGAEEVSNLLDSIDDDKLKFDFSRIQESIEEKISMNPLEFIDNDHFKNNKKESERGTAYVTLSFTEFPKPVNLEILRKNLQGCLDEANKMTYDVSNDKQFDFVKEINEDLKSIRQDCISVAKGVTKACNIYRSCEMSLAKEISMIAYSVAQWGDQNYRDLKESSINFDVSTRQAIYEYSNNLDDHYQYTDAMIESANTLVSEDYSDYYQAIDDMITRASILAHKYQMRAMNEEALIFSENISDYEKFQRLQAVNEALADKVKRGWYNAVAAVKEIFRKFTEKLTANFTTTKNYMDRYKNIILNADFNPNDTYKTQDLGKGIDRIYDDMVIKLNFNDVATTDFSTVGQCFDKFFTKGMGASAGPNVKVPGENASIGDINEYFKTFFCMQGNDHTYTGKEFQQHIKKFYDFLYDIRKINKSIKDGIREVEDNANRIMKQAGLDVNKPATNTTADQTAAPQTAPAASQPAPAAESVYSILYQKYFTLNENGVLVEADINNAGSGTNRAVNNVGKGNTEDDTQTIRNTEKGTVDTKVKAYTDICVSMLKAKMSACEFIRNELMQIIRNHVQAHIGNKAANPQQPQQQQNQQQQTQQPQQQAQQQTQQAKPTFGQRVRNAANALRGQ